MRTQLCQLRRTPHRGAVTTWQSMLSGIERRVRQSALAADAERRDLPPQGGGRRPAIAPLEGRLTASVPTSSNHRKNGFQQDSHVRAETPRSDIFAIQLHHTLE